MTFDLKLSTDSKHIDIAKSYLGHLNVQIKQLGLRAYALAAKI
jgi:hypothetical protein